MSDDERQRGVRNRLRSRTRLGPAKVVGEPNVLSGAAVPNRLSDQATAPKRVEPLPAGTVTGSTRPVVVPGQGAPGRATPSPRPVTDEGASYAPVAGRRLPPLPTLIFLGFAALTAFRLFGQFTESMGSDEPTQAPTATIPRPPGPITFGTGMSEDCEVSGAASEFTEGTDVWWIAELATRQSPTAVVVEIVLVDGKVVQREEWPPEGTAGWDVMCDGPVSEDSIGSHRIEIWNEDETVLHAAGDYTIR